MVDKQQLILHLKPFIFLVNFFLKRLEASKGLAMTTSFIYGTVYLLDRLTFVGRRRGG